MSCHCRDGKLSIRYLQSTPQGKRKIPHKVSSDSQVQLLAFTWWNCLEQTGEYGKGVWQLVVSGFSDCSFGSPIKLTMLTNVWK